MVNVVCFVICLILIAASFAIGDVYDVIERDDMAETVNPMHDKESPTATPMPLSVLQDSNRSASVDKIDVMSQPNSLQDTDRLSRFDNRSDALQEVVPAEPGLVSIRAIIRTCNRLLLSSTSLSIQPAKLIISYVQ